MTARGVLALLTAVVFTTRTEGAVLNFVNSDFAFAGNELLVLGTDGMSLSEGYVALSTSPGLHGILGDSVVTLSPEYYIGAGFLGVPLVASNQGYLTGINLFVIIGSGLGPFESSAYAVIDTGLSFSKADTPPPRDSVDFTAGPDSNVVVGEVAQVTVNASFIGGPVSYTSYALLIPEPSQPLLFVSTVLPFLLRTRRGWRE